MDIIQEISPDMVVELLQQGAMFIDVREPDELAETSFDLENVFNIPLSIFASEFIDIPKDRSIILACHLGVRSYNAAHFLVAKGWDGQKIYSLKGGIDAWSAFGYPIN